MSESLDWRNSTYLNRRQPIDAMRLFDMFTCASPRKEPPAARANKSSAPLLDDARFQAAAATASTLSQLAAAQKLELQALYKRSTDGLAHATPHPSAPDVYGRDEWDVWNKLASLTADEARLRYCTLVEAYGSGGGEDEPSAGGSGPLLKQLAECVVPRWNGMPGSSHAWSDSSATSGNFRVRGRHYVTPDHAGKGRKQPSTAAGFATTGVLLLPAASHIDHVAAALGSPLPGVHADAARADRLQLVLNLQVSVGPTVQHVVFVLERNESADQQLNSARDLEAWRRLYRRAVSAHLAHRDSARSENGESALVAERIKVVPFVADGPGFLKLAINSQRGQLSESLTCKQFEGDGYVEVDVNLDDFKERSVFTRLAKAAIGAVLPQLASITLDLAFMLHTDEEAELPERLLGVVRLHRLKLR